MSKNIDIVILRSFVAVVDYGGVSKAANVLHLTQSAISQHIKRLESILNTSVFDRSGRNFVITQSGEVLFEYASKILKTNDAVINYFSQDVEKRTISIGISEHISHVYLPDILSVCSRVPNIQLDTKIGLNNGLFAGLSDGLLDIALLISEKGTHSKNIVGESKVSWVSSASIHRADYHDELPLVVYNGPCMFRTMMISTLEAHNIPWKVVYNASSIGDLKAALEANMGFSALLSCEINGKIEEKANDLTQMPSLPSVDIILSSRRYGKDPVISNMVDVLNDNLFK